MTRLRFPIRPAGSVLPALALVLQLSACASSAPTRFHTLQTVPATPPTVGYAGPPLQLRSVAVPAALDRAELLREVGAGQFEVRDFDHWAAPLPQLARTTLSEDLALRLPAGKLVFPGASWPAAGAELKVDIQSFRITHGSATMQLSWSLRQRAGSESRKASQANTLGAQLQLQVPASAGAGATSQAFSALLAQLADRIVGALGNGAPPAL